jgi:hypothetical protein
MLLANSAISLSGHAGKDEFSLQENIPRAGTDGCRAHSNRHIVPLERLLETDPEEAMYTAWSSSTSGVIAKKCDEPCGGV